MIYKFKLSADNLELSKAELETLLSSKSRFKGKNAFADLKLSKDKIIEICKRSATIKKLYLTDKEIWRAKKGRFAEREPKQRPGFHPTALKPKLARLLVNLSGAKKGDRILDPFCGCGAVLLEASMLGIKSVGIDLDMKALDRAKLNLRCYGAKGWKLKLGDATKIKGKFDAIVTDPPYGRSSKVLANSLKDLYSKFFDAVRKTTNKAVVMLPSKIKIDGFKVLGKFDIYVHKSLTRRIWVLQC